MKMDTKGKIGVPFILFFGFWILWGGTAWAGGQAEIVESVGNGEINWSQGFLTAKGSGAPPPEAKNIAQARLLTEKAALADARLNLLEVLKGIHLDSATLVGDALAKEESILMQLEGLIQDAPESKEKRKYLADGAIELSLTLGLSRDLLGLMIQLSKGEKEGKYESNDRPGPEPLVGSGTNGEILAGASPPPGDMASFTGLVVDTRGLNMRVVLIPRILDENGQELYPGNLILSGDSAQNGLALYLKGWGPAQTHSRVGKNPLIVKAWKLFPSGSTNILLSAGDARRLAPYTQKGNFLEKCRVLILLD